MGTNEPTINPEEDARLTYIKDRVTTVVCAIIGIRGEEWVGSAVPLAEIIEDITDGIAAWIYVEEEEWNQRLKK